MANKAKQGEEELQYSESKTKRYKISINRINIEIHYKDGMKISKDNQCNWFISEMYTNRANIEQIWIKFYAMYYPNYELGADSQLTIEEYNIWIYENNLSIETRSENCDDIVYTTANEIRDIFMNCPDKYDKTIKGKFFRSQALYLAIGLAVAIIFSLFLNFSLMPKYEILSTTLSNKLIFALAFIFVAEFSGTIVGNEVISSMYKRISPKQKYSGYNRNTHTNTYVDDIEQYKSNPEVMIGINTYNTWIE